MLDYIARGIILKQFKNKACQITSQHFRREAERLTETTCKPLQHRVPGWCSLWSPQSQWLPCSKPVLSAFPGFALQLSSAVRWQRPVVWGAANSGEHTEAWAPSSLRTALGPGSEALISNSSFVGYWQAPAASALKQEWCCFDGCCLSRQLFNQQVFTEHLLSTVL